MRPVMGAPDDTPQIHGLIDEIERLREALEKIAETNYDLRKAWEFAAKAKEIAKKALEG